MIEIIPLLNPKTGINTKLWSLKYVPKMFTALSERGIIIVLNVAVIIEPTEFIKIEGKPILLAAHDGILDRAKLFLKRCFFENGNAIGAIDLFGGIAEVKRCGGIGLELTVKAKTQGLAQEFPIRRYYPQGTYSTSNGVITSDDETNDYALITPYVPLKEVLI